LTGVTGYSDGYGYYVFGMRRQGTVFYRGKPVAEIRAIRDAPATIEARLDDLERQGIVVGSGKPMKPMKPMKAVGRPAGRPQAVSRGT